jgi:APA family basic amino acid/polyamine antiporter
MFPEAGGSASFARHGFNELIGFGAGWALLLDYIVTMAISAFTIAPYLGYFWAPLKDSQSVGVLAAMGIIAFLMVINIIGVRESSVMNFGAALLDIATQVTLVILGLILVFDLPTLIGRITTGWPSHPTDLVLGVALASLAYTGVETMSQMAEETRLAEQRVPKALIMMMVTVLVIYLGISNVAISVMPPEVLATTWAEDPVAGIASNLPFEGLRDFFRPLVAVLAATILLIATNAGLIGASRMAFSMSIHRQVPKLFSRVHFIFRTPYISIITFCSFALAILVPGFFVPGIFVDLGAVYSFGSLMSFGFAHASIISLRVRRPRGPRPFKLGPNIRIGRYDIPLTAVIGLLATLVVWVVVVIVRPYSRWVGLGWMILGIVGYIFYRRRHGLPLTRPPRFEDRASGFGVASQP